MVHNQIPTTPGIVRIHRLDAAAVGVGAVIVGAKVVTMVITAVVDMIMIEVDIVMGIAVDMVVVVVVVAINKVINGQLKVKSAVTPVGLGRIEYKGKKQKQRVV